MKSKTKAPDLAALAIAIFSVGIVLAVASLFAGILEKDLFAILIGVTLLPTNVTGIIVNAISIRNNKS